MPPVVKGISPRYGSTAGNTLITVYGSNMDALTKGGGRQSGSRITLGEKPQVPCIRVDYYSDNNQIVCYTPPQGSLPSTVPVKVNYWGGEAECLPGVQCSFQYRNDRTPYIQSLSDSVPSGHAFHIAGSLRGGGPKDFRVELGGFPCRTEDPAWSANPFNGGKNLNALAPEVEAGYYNLSLQIQNSVGFGEARHGRSSGRMLEDGTRYSVAVFPSIDAISASSSGTSGGDVVTIAGSGFSTELANNKITVAGTDCAVTSATLTRLTCVTQPAPESTGADKMKMTICHTPADGGEARQTLEILVSDWPEYQAKGDTRGPCVDVDDTSNRAADRVPIPRHSHLELNSAESDDDDETHEHYGLRARDLDEAQLYHLRQSGEGTDPADSDADGDEEAAEEAAAAASNFVDPSPAEVLGGRGLRRRVWRKKDKPEGSPQVTGIVSDSLYLTSASTSYYEILDGFLIPPYSGQFQLYIAADDWASISVSSDHLMKNLPTEPQAVVPKYTTSYYANPQQISAPMNLVEGQSYYVRVNHYQGGGASSLRVALRAINAPVSDEFKANYAVVELQQFSIYPSVTRETQEFWIQGATEGTFTVSINNQLAGMAVNVTDSGKLVAQAIAAAARKAKTCSSITNMERTEANGRVTFSYTMNCRTGSGHPLVKVHNLRLLPRGGVQFSNEATRTATASEPLGGTYRLNLGTYGVTEELDAYASSSKVREALQALEGIDEVEVARAWAPTDGVSYTMRFINPRDRVPVTLQTESITGYNVSASEKNFEAGNRNDVMYDPIPGSMLRVATAAGPPIIVESNSVLAACGVSSLRTRSEPLIEADGPMLRGSCSFMYSSFLTSTFTSVAPAAVKVGDTVTVVGTGFDPVPSRNHLQLGNTGGGCHGETVNEQGTQFICKIADTTTAGQYTPKVVVYGKGLAKASSVGQVEVSAEMKGIVPSQGSVFGGAMLTVIGTGFPSKEIRGWTVSIGSADCKIVEQRTTGVVCTVPAHPNPNVQGRARSPVTIATGAARANGNYNYVYDRSLTPTVTGISPSPLSFGITRVITLTGSFPDDTYTVSVAGKPCLQRSRANNQLTCQLARGLPSKDAGSSPYTPVLRADNYGTGQVTASVPITLGLTSFSTNEGSKMGGQTITIQGTGFPGTWIRESLLVYYWYGPKGDEFGTHWPRGRDRGRCEPDIAKCTTESIVCTTYKPYFVMNTTMDIPAIFDIRVNNVSVPCPGMRTNPDGTVSGGTCAFTFKESLTGRIQSVWPELGKSGDTVTIRGTNFVSDGAKLMVGANEIPVQSMNQNEVVFSAPALEYGSAHFDLLSHYGNSISNMSAMFNYTFNVTSIYPLSGSIGGAQAVTLRGYGFGPGSQVMFGGRYGKISRVSSDELVVLAPRKLTRTAEPVYLYQTSLDHSKPGKVPEAGAWRTRFDTHVFFEYDESLTAYVKGVQPFTSKQGETITITGSGFGESQDKSVVSLSYTPCNVQTWADEEITCTVGAFTPAGVHPVHVFMADKGAAEHPGSPDTTITIDMTVNRLGKSDTASFAGNAQITLTGTGFAGNSGRSAPALGYPTPMAMPGESQPEEATVKICGTSCQVTEASNDAIKCTTGAIITDWSAARLNLAATTPIPGDTYFGMLDGIMQSRGASFAVRAFDGDIGTELDWGIDRECFVGFRVAPGKAATVSSLRYFPRFAKAGLVIGGIFQVQRQGTGKARWDTVHEVVDRPQAHWNTATFEPVTEVVAVRYVGPEGSRCQIAEIEFMGIMTDAVAAKLSETEENPNDLTCPVLVHNPVPTGWFPLDLPNFVLDKAFGSGGIFRLTEAQSPIITGVSPNNGTALGGTSITLTGTSLAPSSGRTSDVKVSVHGHPCRVTAVSDDAVVCTTSPRDEIMLPKIEVDVAGKGRAGVATGVKFRYLDKWSALTSWRFNEPPVEDDFVIIPEGQAIMLDETPPRLFVLLVQGELIFDNTDLQLNSSYILVHGGRLEVGTEENPFTHNAVITLHGTKDSVELPYVGAKVLAVMNREPGIVGPGGIPLPEIAASEMPTGSDMQNPITSQTRIGVLDLHGIPRVRSWTKVAENALEGATEVVLSEPVDFAAGERVVLTSSRGASLIEELTVASTSADGTTVTFTAPLQNTHNSSIQVIEGRVVDMRVEIGLLTRNIVIQGDDSSEKDRFGVHTMANHGGYYRLENVEVTKCGQLGRPGRYCTHFHQVGAVDPEKTYVRSNSIHHSYQRGVAVHGTHYARISDNVAYNTLGHTYYVEGTIDASNNIFEGNLAVMTRSTPWLREMSANFFSRSPSQFWRHNVGSGSQNDGFFLNPSREHTALGEFYNNTVHSSGGHALRISPSYLPEDEVRFDNLTSWRNGGSCLYTAKGGAMHLHGITCIESGESAVRWVEHPNSVYNDWGNIVDLLAVGSLEVNHTGSIGIELPKDEFFFVDGATLVNYAVAGLKACTGCVGWSQSGFTTRTRGLTFVDTPKKLQWNTPYREIYHDLDGSLLGQPSTYGSPNNPWNLGNNCKLAGEELDEGLVCNPGIILRRLQIMNVAPKALARASAMLNGHSSRRIGFHSRDNFFGWCAPVITNTEYLFQFLQGSNPSQTDWQSIEVRYSEPDYMLQNEWFRLRFTHIDYRWNYAVTYNEMGLRPWLPFGEVPSQANDLGTGAMAKEYENGEKGEKSWSVVVTTNNISATGYTDYLDNYRPYGTPEVSTSPDGRGQYAMMSDGYQFSVQALQCSPTMASCQVPEGVELGQMMMWSDPNAWPSGQVPREGEDVIIMGNMYIVLDVYTPPLGQILVHGKLEFMDGVDLTLNVESIAVSGIFQIGSMQKPYGSNAKIVFHGDRYSPTVVIDDSLFLGNKMMAVVGEVQMWGQPRAEQWTKLFLTAQPGTNKLELIKPVDWKVGEQVVVGTTEYDVSQCEKRTITAVSEDGQTITVDRALAYRHFAGTIDGGSLGSVKLRAAVGLLSRNIVFEGDLSDGTPYGAHLTVADLPNGNRVGRAEIHDVLFRNVGKEIADQASVQFRYTNPNFEPKKVDSCVFDNAMYYGIKTWGATHIEIRDNVVYNSRYNGIELDEMSIRAKIVGNLVVQNDISPLLLDPESEDTMIKPQASFFINNVPAQLKNNVAAGSYDSGYIMRAPVCGKFTFTGDFVNNEVMGVKVGFFLLGERDGDPRECVELMDSIVWKAGDVGVLAVDSTASIRLYQMVVSDSHMGISLNYASTDFRMRSMILNSLISGSTAASTCDASVECRAMGPVDIHGKACNSIFGDSYRRIGIVMPQVSRTGKTCGVGGPANELSYCFPVNRPTKLCAMPWVSRYSVLGSPYSSVALDNVVFANWKAVDCGRQNYAVSLNVDQPDYTPVLMASKIEWFNVDHPATYTLGTQKKTTDLCPNGDCDALKLFMIKDLDGTFSDDQATGDLKPGYLTGNSNLADSTCTYDDVTKAHHCPNQKLIPGSVAGYGMDRSVGSVRLIKLNEEDSDSGSCCRDVVSDGGAGDKCAEQAPSPAFPLAWENNTEYRVETRTPMPEQARIVFGSRSVDDAVLVHLFYENPENLVVLLGDEELPSKGRPVSLADDSGSYFHNSAEKTLTLVMRGQETLDLRAFTIRTLPLIKLQATLAVPVEEFYSDRVIEHVSTLLDIDADRIKIAHVSAGSTIVNMTIQDSEPVPGLNDTAAEDQVRRLQKMARSIEKKVTEGSFDAGYDVLAVTVAPPAYGAFDTEAQVKSDLHPPEGPPKPFDYTPVIIGVALPCVLLSLGIVGFLIHREMKRRKDYIAHMVDPATTHRRGHGLYHDGLAEREQVFEGDDGFEEGDVEVGVQRNKKQRKAAKLKGKKASHKVASEDTLGDVEMTTKPSTELLGHGRKVAPDLDDDDLPEQRTGHGRKVAVDFED